MSERAVVIAGGERDPGQQQTAAGGGEPAGQLCGGAQVAERQAQQRLKLIGARQQRGAGLGHDQARGLRGRQRVADLPAGRPDPGPVEQREELEEGPPPLGDRQRSLSELLGGVEVSLLQRQAGQRAQVVHGEEMLVESEPPGVRLGGPGGVGGVGEVAGLKRRQRPRTGHEHQPGRLAERGHRQGRRRLPLNGLAIVQAVIDTQEDQRDDGGPLVLDQRLLLDGPRVAGLGDGLVQPAEDAVAE